jgi:uncharacterized protein (TIGR02452 family)
MSSQNFSIKPYCVLRFRYYYQENKVKAFKYVYYHNSLLIMNDIPRIPLSIDYDNDLLEKHLKASPIKGYKNTELSFCQVPIDQAMYYYSNKKYNTCGLNFSNQRTAGGLYNLGMTGKEEELCRVCPTLYNSLLNTKAYPFKWDKTIIFSPNVLLSRDSMNNYDFYNKPTNVSIISGCYPMQLNMNTKYKKIKKIIQKLFIIPAINNCDCIILNAWGCDESKIDPHVIANLFCELIIKHRKIYKVICIAIPKSYNYEVFHTIFEENDLI